MEWEDMQKLVKDVKNEKHIELPLRCLVTFMVEYDGKRPLVIRKKEGFQLGIRTLNICTVD